MAGISDKEPVVTFAASGATATFDFDFWISDTQDLLVTLDGAIQVLGTNYSVAIAAAPDDGGVVTWIGANPVGVLIISRDMALERQSIDYQEGGDFLAAILNKDQNRAVALVQQLYAAIKRAIKVPLGETADKVLALSPAARASQLAGYDINGDPTVYSPASLSATVIPTAHGIALLADATPAQTRATIDVYSTAEVNVIAASLAKSFAPNPFFEVDQSVIGGGVLIADDTYGHDHWYALSETAPVVVGTRAGGLVGRYYTMAQVSQNQAAAQRMGYACILEQSEAKKLRGQQVTFRPDIQCSVSQAIRVAIVEFIGTADVVVSDIVNDWTSGAYTAGNFFIAGATVNTGRVTPIADDLDNSLSVNATIGPDTENIVLFVWTEAVAAQFVTLSLGAMRFVLGAIAPDLIYVASKEETLRYAQRFYEKSFPYETAPAQAVAASRGTWDFIQSGAAGLATQTPSYRFRVAKVQIPHTLITYNPGGANALIRNISRINDTTLNSPRRVEKEQFSLTYTNSPGSASGDLMSVDWTADARL